MFNLKSTYVLFIGCFLFGFSVSAMEKEDPNATKNQNKIADDYLKDITHLRELCTQYVELSNNKIAAEKKLLLEDTHKMDELNGIFDPIAAYGTARNKCLEAQKLLINTENYLLFHKKTTDIAIEWLRDKSISTNLIDAIDVERIGQSLLDAKKLIDESITIITDLTIATQFE